jgi:23S rRNA pseudouridine2605 synthase
MRLARMIALSSELSRRAAEKAIVAGEVIVNDDVVTELGTSVDILKDRVSLNGVKLRIADEAIYLVYNKPRLKLVTKSDPEERELIWDDIPEFKRRCNSVGRLDYDSEGLLIITDDGDFLNMLTHPKHEIWKTYRVRLKGTPTKPDIERLKSGVIIEGRRTLPAKLKQFDREGDCAVFEISIREGRKRQVRMMFESVGYPVSRLKRLAVGPVKIGRLAPGSWRHMTSAEVEVLKSLASKPGR